MFIGLTAAQIKRFYILGIFIVDLSFDNIQTAESKNKRLSVKFYKILTLWTTINNYLSALKRYPRYRERTNDRLFIHKTHVVTFIAKRSGLESVCLGTANWKCKRLLLVVRTLRKE